MVRSRCFRPSWGRGVLLAAGHRQAGAYRGKGDPKNSHEYWCRGEGGQNKDDGYTAATGQCWWWLQEPVDAFECVAAVGGHGYGGHGHAAWCGGGLCTGDQRAGQIDAVVMADGDVVGVQFDEPVDLAVSVKTPMLGKAQVSSQAPVSSRW